MIKTIIAIIIVVGVWYAWSHPVVPYKGEKVTLQSIVMPLVKNHTVEIGCTMEAKICSDGSSVGRQGPMCEFEKCPGEE